MPHVSRSLHIRPDVLAAIRQACVRLCRVLAFLPAMTPAFGADPPLHYLCRQPDGSERRVPADAALQSRRAGLACLPVITGRPPTGDADIVTVHVGITEIAGAPEAAHEASRHPASLPAPPPSIAESLAQAARRHRLEPSLVAAVMYVESRYRPQARSPKGALGLMQLMPATASQYGVSTEQALLDPHVNIDVGAQHLRSLLDRFGDRLDLVLAAYNAGEGAVARHGHRVPPYAETRDYVRKVMALMEAAASGL